MKRLSLLLFLFCLAFCCVAQDATTLYQEGLQLKGEKKIKEAVEKFKQAVRQKAVYTEALYELGWCQNDLKDYAGAIQALRQRSRR